MNDFTNEIQIEEITGTPTQADWEEYHEWLDSLEGEVDPDEVDPSGGADHDPQDDCSESEWQELYGAYDWDRDFYDCD